MPQSELALRAGTGSIRLSLDEPDAPAVWDRGLGDAGRGAVAEPKRRRRRPAVVVGPQRAVPLTPEDYELAIHTIAAMVARWWDANGRKMSDGEDHKPPRVQGRRR